MSNWYAFDDGRSIGKVSREGGVILRDEAHKRGARITLKRGSGHIAVSCYIQGWMDHTRFFNSVPEAQREFVLMRSSIESILENTLTPGAKDIKVWEEISNFVRRFP